MPHVITIAAVALGGALGALARFGVARLVERTMPTFPLGTMIVNVVGCFLIGVLTIYFADKSNTALRTGVLVGFLGALTTFSTYSYESLMLLEKGQHLAAALNVAGSVILCLLAAFGGLALGKAMFAG